MPSKRLYSLFDLYTIKDVIGVWKRSWKTIIVVTLAFILFGAYWSLSEPIRYTAEGTFREKSSSRSVTTPPAISTLLLSHSGEAYGSSAIATMKSRTMMEELIRRTGLQAVIVPENSSKSFFKRAMDNLRVEYALFMNDKIPTIKDVKKDLAVLNIDYAEEVPLGLQIQFIDDQTFVVKGQDIEGHIDQRVELPTASFVIKRLTSNALAGQVFNITIWPLHHAAHDLSKLITVTPDKDDSAVLRIRYRHEDRHQAVNFVNTVMQLYQEYMKAEHKKMMSTQIGYLEKRQGEVFDLLQDKMSTYAETLSEDFSNLGFIDSEKAMDFLAANQHGIKSKQFTINSEINRLEKVLHDKKISIESLTGIIESSFLNKLLVELRDLKQQYDAIQVALSAAQIERKYDQQISFESNIYTLKSLTTYLQDTEFLIAELEASPHVPASIPDSLNDPSYMVASWHQKLKEDHSPDLKEKFINYLHNLAHHFKVYSKAIEENLSHQQSSFSPELQGMNLSIANEIFFSYRQEINAVESQILQLKFVLEQLQEPDFELSSLSALLTDSVSRDIAINASNLALAINDKSNRTEKELLRLQEDLRLQRKFISMHLKQTLSLLTIKLNLLQEKLQAVRHSTLGIIQQLVGILENQIYDQIRNRLDNLHQELSLLDKQQLDLQKHMQALPKKWVSEQLIHQRMEMHRQMSREITNLVESKNISSNLEIIQSTPVDQAIPPLQPDSPRFLFFMCLGAFVGLFCSSATVLMKTLSRGIPVSSETLRALGLQVIGVYASAKDRAMTLKRLSYHLLNPFEKKIAQKILLAQGNVSLAEELAAQLTTQGTPTVALPWQNSLSENHEWIIAYSNLSPSDPIFLNYLDRFDFFIGVVQEEPLTSLELLIERLTQKEILDKAIFITRQ